MPFALAYPVLFPRETPSSRAALSLAAAAALSLVPSVFAAPVQDGAVTGGLPAGGKSVVPSVPGVPIMARDDDACSAVLVDVKADISVHIDALSMFPTLISGYRV